MRGCFVTILMVLLFPPALEGAGSAQVWARGPWPTNRDPVIAESSVWADLLPLVRLASMGGRVLDLEGEPVVSSGALPDVDWGMVEVTAPGHVRHRVKLNGPVEGGDSQRVILEPGVVVHWRAVDDRG
jgi:hypothetical protein